MFRAFITLILGGLFFTAPAKGQTPDHRFYQKVQTYIPLPAAAGTHVLRLFTSQDAVIAVTANGVFRHQHGRWTGNATGGNWILATMDVQNMLWLASKNMIRSEAGKTIALPAAVWADTLLCLFWENPQTLYLGTTGGMYVWTGEWNSLPQFKGLRINDMVSDARKTLWVATNDGLWRRTNSKWLNLDDYVMADGNERKYYALATGNNGLDIIFSAPRSVGCIAANGEHWMLRATDGLPYGPATSIRTVGQQLWLGTAKGAVQKDSAWHYYNGKRWLAAEQVNDILPLPGKVWIATPGGISELRDVNITLTEKAAHYDSIIDLRHNRRGLVNISKLTVPGDVSTSYTENEDNDGLWTSCYLAAQCFRYAVTGHADARQKAVRTFEALERLETITGIPGYPARSYAAATDSVKPSRSPHPKQWHSSTDAKWQWLDDTSSDEITGHMFTLSLFYELVADTMQKQRVKQLINRIATHIVDNDYRLIDYDGKPTRWGIWHPDSLNNSPNWMYERGLNSLQILSFLVTASHFTGNPRFEKAYQTLVKKHGYARNAVLAKMYGPFETSHSDDILNFFPYYGLLRYTPGDTDRNLYIKSLERSWQAVRGDRMPVWNVIASALLNKNCGLAIALEEIRQYPLDLVGWSIDNSHRWDLQVDPLVGRGASVQAVHPVPTPESNISRWNTNPKSLNAGRKADGLFEETGTYFLFAYWMGRYYNFFTE